MLCLSGFELYARWVPLNIRNIVATMLQRVCWAKNRRCESSCVTSP